MHGKYTPAIVPRFAFWKIIVKHRILLIAELFRKDRFFPTWSMPPAMFPPLSDLENFA